LNYRRIIPCLDVKDGRLVKGINFIDLKDVGDPSENGAVGSILPTSMDADGTQTGYDIPMTKAIFDAVSLPVIASGGAGTLEHLHEAITVAHADAVLVASIAHYGTYTIRQMKQYLADQGITVRL
jgi:cyclase